MADATWTPRPVPIDAALDHLVQAARGNPVVRGWVQQVEDHIRDLRADAELGAEIRVEIERHGHPTLMGIAARVRAGDGWSQPHPDDPVDYGPSSPELLADFRAHTSRLVAQNGPELDRRQTSLAVMALGLAGESGEVADEIKKVLGHGKPADPAKIANEVGDVLFYADRVLAAFGLTLGDAMRANVTKLQARYPDGFDNAERRFGFTAAEGA